MVSKNSNIVNVPNGNENSCEMIFLTNDLIFPNEFREIRRKQFATCTTLTANLYFRVGPQSFDCLSMHISIIWVHEILTVTHRVVGVDAITDLLDPLIS